MKIVILNWRSIKDPLSGGAESATYEIARRLISVHNCQVTWISPFYDYSVLEEEIHGIKFIYLGNILKRDDIFNLIYNFPYFIYQTYKYYNQYLKGKCDVVIDQVHGLPFFTPLYVKENKIVYIHEVAGEIWDKMYKFPINALGKFFENNIFKLIYKNVKFITGSNSTFSSLLKIGIDKNNINIVSYGIDIQGITKPTEKFKDFTILYLNRLVKMKGPERALTIFSKLQKIIPESKMIIIGRGEEAYINSLKKYATDLNILKNVEFKGFISLDQKVDYLQKSHVLINTSYKEGWGLVNLEANSQGTPVVAFDVDGCRESVKNGVSGYIVNNEDEFVEKILELKNVNLQQSSIEFSKQFNYDDKSEEFWKVLNG